MWKTAQALPVNLRDRQLMQELAGAASTPQRVIQRLRIVLGAAEGRPNNQLAKELGISRPTVLLWRRRYLTAGVLGLLKDAPRPGRPRRRRLPVAQPALATAMVAQSSQ